MTSQTPEELEAEHAEQADQLLEALTIHLPNDDAIDAYAEITPILAAIRRHAAAAALREAAAAIGKRAQADRLRAAQQAPEDVYMRNMYGAYAEQGLTDARRLRRAADDVIAEGWEHTCSVETPATREDPAEGCETPVEHEGDTCPRHTDDRDQ